VGPAAWLGVGRPALVFLTWDSRSACCGDARSRLICAGWLPQEELFGWNGITVCG
jgi:hypothetical protein